MARIEEINFDVPEAFDDEIETDNARNEATSRNVHLRLRGERATTSIDDIILEVHLVVFFEGILAPFERLRDLMDLKILWTDADVRLARRIGRRRRAREDVDSPARAICEASVNGFVLPTKRRGRRRAEGAENAVAIDLLVRGIRERTLERSEARSIMGHHRPHTAV